MMKATDPSLPVETYPFLNQFNDHQIHSSFDETLEDEKELIGLPLSTSNPCGGFRWHHRTPVCLKHTAYGNDCAYCDDQFNVYLKIDEVNDEQAPLLASSFEIESNENLSIPYYKNALGPRTSASTGNLLTVPYSLEYYTNMDRYSPSLVLPKYTKSRDHIDVTGLTSLGSNRKSSWSPQTKFHQRSSAAGLYSFMGERTGSSKRPSVDAFADLASALTKAARGEPPANCTPRNSFQWDSPAAKANLARKLWHTSRGGTSSGSNVSNQSQNVPFDPVSASLILPSARNCRRQNSMPATSRTPTTRITSGDRLANTVVSVTPHNSSTVSIHRASSPALGIPSTMSTNPTGHHSEVSARTNDPNPIYNIRDHRHNKQGDDIFSDIMRASGYSSQFRRLLSRRRTLVEDAPEEKKLEPVRVQFEPGSPEQVSDLQRTSLDLATEDMESDKINGGMQMNRLQIPDKITPIKKQGSRYGVSAEDPSQHVVRHRLRVRKRLFYQRSKVCDYTIIFAFLGIALAVIEGELCAWKGDNNQMSPLEFKMHWSSILLRCLIVVSTLILLSLIVLYHAIEMKVSMIDSGADDWRVAITSERAIQMSIELVVCSICPLPGTGVFYWPFLLENHRKIGWAELPVDVALSVPMFARTYLLCRFMVLHSKQFQDAATRSIAALNRISVDFKFVVKTLMAQHPIRVLVVFTISYWICVAWALTQCERYTRGEGFGPEPEDNFYLNSLWFVMITFMSIGYGDIVPNTYCGRTLAITTGIVGAGVSSALIAVIASKLELSRAEKHVNTFMSDSKLTRARKNAAASVLQQTWFIHKYKKEKKAKDEIKVRLHQRRFLAAITEFRRIKWDQRNLAEQSNSLLDFGKLHNDMHESMWEMQRVQEDLVGQVDLLSDKINQIHQLLIPKLGSDSTGTIREFQETV